MPNPFFIGVSFEIVAEVENLVTLRREILVAMFFPWGPTFYIVEAEEPPS